MDEAVVGLSEAIDASRVELTEAVAKRKEQRIQFALHPIERQGRWCGGR